MEKLPRDTYNEVRAVLAGYERRKEKYLEVLEELRDPMKATRYDKILSSRTVSSESQQESIMDRILEYEKSPNAQRVHAVDLARDCLITKYSDEHEGEAYAERIFKAICLNCENRHEYPHHVLNRTMNLYMGRTKFSDVKSEILDVIADYLQLK